MQLLLAFLALLPQSIYSTSKIVRYNGEDNFTQLCNKFAQNCEEHEVVTEDGYLLTVHRIKGDETKPILLWHGLLVSSESYIGRGPNSTAVSLSAEGYDVWLGNSRGNRYSRRHVYLDPDKNPEEFWDFSSHEKGYYDMSATIDYVLSKTGQEKLTAIGHSQGTTMFYILASTRPAYNDKIKLFISMAPIAFLSHMKSLVRVIFESWSVIRLLVINNYELLNEQSLINKFVQNFCTINGWPYEACYDLLMIMVGYDPERLDPEFLKIVFAQALTSISKKELEHYSQVVKRKRFSRIDMGIVRNFVNYGRFTPPDYDLSRVTAPVAILCAENDYLSTIKDVETLKSKLPNVVNYHVIEYKMFNHFDYIFGTNINVYVNPHVKRLLNDYS